MENKRYTGDSTVLQKIVFFIHSKNWEINGVPVHTGNDNYEIAFLKTPLAPLAGIYYRGKFWIEGDVIHHKEIIYAMS